MGTTSVDSIPGVGGRELLGQPVGRRRILGEAVEIVDRDVERPGGRGGAAWTGSRPRLRRPKLPHGQTHLSKRGNGRLRYWPTAPPEARGVSQAVTT